jgi:glycosyltransferase involved in cell wall biosynthesis
MIDSLGLRESVLMRGMQRDVREYYWAADVFVLPSRTEGLSNAMLEAMACGLPSVCTSVGGTPDWVRHGDNGMLCSPEDPVELQCTLVDMLNNQTEWEAMGLYSRNLAERELSWGKMLSDIESLYRGLG